MHQGVNLGAPFGAHFGANMAPFSIPKSTQIYSKMDPKSHANSDRVLNHLLLIVGPFGTQVEPMLDPSWDQYRLASPRADPGPFWLLLASSWTSRAAYGVPKHPTWSTQHPKMASPTLNLDIKMLQNAIPQGALPRPPNTLRRPSGMGWSLFYMFIYLFMGLISYIICFI